MDLNFSPQQAMPMTWMQWLSMDQAQADQRSLIEAMQRFRAGQPARWDQDLLGQLDLEDSLRERLRVQTKGIQGITDWLSAMGDYASPDAPNYGQDTLKTPNRIVWRNNVAELVRFGDQQGTPVIWVPAPINKANILDLSDDRSVVARQLQLGLDPYVLVWRNASDQHAPQIDDYCDAIVAAATWVGTPLNLAGYCLGGALAAKAAQRLPDLASLSLIAAPMDGQAGALSPWLTAAQRNHTKLMASVRGLVPAGVLAAGFVGLKPEAWRGLFNRHRQKTLTQWLLDGMNLSPSTWDWIVDEVYGNGVAAHIGPFKVPTWVQSFDNDHLVPPQQLAGEKGVIHARAPGGHNGGLLRTQPGQWLDGWCQWLPKTAPVDNASWPDLGPAHRGYICEQGVVA